MLLRIGFFSAAQTQMAIHFRRTFRRHHRGSPGFTEIAKGARDDLLVKGGRAAICQTSQGRR
jgi:hypothetical protein